MLSAALKNQITGVVLAGGQGRRMGGDDKGLVELAGRPLVSYVLDALRPQVGKVLINANRNSAAYAALGCPVVADDLAGYQGPLAGFVSAMAAADTPYIVTVPCDGPRLPPDLVQRLYGERQAAAAEVAVAHDGERLQPVHALLSTALLTDLRAFLDAGDRKIDLWYARHRMAVVDFSDRPEAFENVNTPQQLSQLEQELTGHA
ncbi:MAG: molybdenum cofactor guanylyltransferase [Pseudomonadota bacterium]|jgi:molybdenum cofactor guanylyltransferase